MRPVIPLFLCVVLIQSCSSTNRIYSSHDEFRDQEILKLNQPLKGYSDELRRKLFSAPYSITFKHFYSSGAEGETMYTLELNLETLVRAYEISPELYISADGEKFRIKSEEQITKLYQAGSSSSASETHTSTQEDPENKEEEITETTTTYTTSSSHNTYQFMQIRLYPNLPVMRKIRESSDVIFKIYIANEGIEIPFTSRYKRKYDRYFDLIDGSL